MRLRIRRSSLLFLALGMVTLSVWPRAGQSSQMQGSRGSDAQASGQPSLVAQLGHSETVNSVAFSPDGRRVLTGSLDSTAKLWDAETGQVIRTFAVNLMLCVYSVAFSPDERWVLTGSTDNGARLWDAETGQVIRTFAGHSNSVNSVAFSDDGKMIVTGSDDKTAMLWLTETGQSLTFTGHSAEVKSVAWFASSARASVLTGSKDKTAKLWDAETGQELRTFAGHS